MARLKADVDGDLVILGSGELIRSLMRRNLIDQSTLLIHPLILGSGRRLFADDVVHAPAAAVQYQDVHDRGGDGDLPADRIDGAFAERVKDGRLDRSVVSQST